MVVGVLEDIFGNGTSSYKKKKEKEKGENRI